MENVFVEIFNMGLTATWVVFAVLAVRALCHKAPRSLTVCSGGEYSEPDTECRDCISGYFVGGTAEDTYRCLGVKFYGQSVSFGAFDTDIGRQCQSDADCGFYSNYCLDCRDGSDVCLQSGFLFPVAA